MKTTVYTCASLIALSLAAVAITPAMAQKATADSATATGDIIVTATRQETKLSKTAVAITAITGDKLRSEGVVSPTNLGDHVPNLSIDRTNGLQITIRGVTSTDGTEKGDPSAAFMLDGIYIARPQEADVSFFDVNRVEVLRGPQGTLYGRNTTAGVVNLITNKPTIGKFEAGANAGYGNYNALNIDGYVNAPISDAAAFRLAASYDSRDNYIKTLPGDPISQNPFRKNFAVRGQFLFKPTSSLSILLRGDFASLGGSRVSTGRNFFSPPATASVLNPATNSQVTVPLNSPLYTGDNFSTDYHLTNSYLNTPVPSKQFGGGNQDTTNPLIKNTSVSGSGEINYDFGPAIATYIGSYRHYVAHENQELNIFGAGSNAVAATFDGDYKETSHELRLATNNISKLKLQAGLYYFREHSVIAFYLLNFPPVGAPVFGFPQETTSSTLGGYGNATYSLTDRIRLTLGGRYSSDKKFRYGHTVIGTTFNPKDQFVRNQNSADIANITHAKFTWTAGLEGDVGAHGLAYGKVSTGYKAGGFNDGCTAGTTTNGELCNQARPFGALYYQPETLTAYEVGYKDRLFNDVLTLGLSVFHYDYKNLQLSQLASCGAGCINQVTQNAAKASVTGVEFESTIRIDPRNRFELAYNYTDAHYTSFCPFGLALNSTACFNQDFAGRPLDRSPRSVVNATYTYTLPLDGGSSLVAQIHDRLSGSYVITNYGGAYQYRQPSFNKVDLSLTYNGPESKYYIQAYGNNLSNQVQVSNVDGFGNSNVTDPRTYGIRAGFKF
jgi:iron complex outermembrane receptor protein